MDQRVGDFFDQTLVQLGAFADGAQTHMLAEAAGQIADQAWEATEHRVHRQHAHADDSFLQIAGIAFQQVQAREQALGMHRVQATGHLLEHGLGNDQLTDQVDQCVHLVNADADGGFGVVIVACRRFRGLGGGRGDRSGCRLRGLHRQAGRGGRADVELAVVDHPGKRVFDAAARHLANQAQIPGEVGFQRIQLLEARQPLHARLHVQRTQGFQFTDDTQRIIAAHEQ